MKTIELTPLEWHGTVHSGCELSVGLTKQSKFLVRINSNRMDKHKWFNYETNARKFVLDYVKKHKETEIVSNDFWDGNYELQIKSNDEGLKNEN